MAAGFRGRRVKTRMTRERERESAGESVCVCVRERERENIIRWRRADEGDESERA